jgi:hypothetical protein
MSKRTQKSFRPPAKPQQSVIREAWSNMTEDLDRILPESLRRREGKKKFVLWLFVVEVLVLGVIGKLIYAWWAGR